MDTKTCQVCNEDLTLEYFHRNSRMRDGHLNSCKFCRREHRSKYDGSGRYPQYRRSYLKRKFGITLEEYEEMHRAQNGVCAICSRDCPSGRDLAVDHNHETGVIRGLLCMSCNRTLGMMGEDPVRLQNMIDYIGRII